MKYYLSPSQDAAYNQALEEHLYLAYPGQDLLLLWRNRPAVVCGKFQNIYQEVNILEAQARGVSLVRRISGGGTVYHDLGNVNYSLIGHKEGLGANYRPILEKVCASLALLGADVQILDEISLGVGGLKISGSAQASSQDRLLHHGTLLYDSDLAALQSLANGHNENFSTRGTKSVPWPVGNLRAHLAKRSPNVWGDSSCGDIFWGATSCEDPLCSNPFCGDTSTFLTTWLTALQQIFAAQEAFQLTAADQEAVNRLYQEKYTSWTWTFAQGPAFSYHRDIPASSPRQDTGSLQSPSSRLDTGSLQSPNYRQDSSSSTAFVPGPLASSSPMPTQATLTSISYTVKKGIIQEFTSQPACPQLSNHLVGAPLEPGHLTSQLLKLGLQHLLPYLFG